MTQLSSPTTNLTTLASTLRARRPRSLLSLLTALALGLTPLACDDAYELEPGDEFADADFADDDLEDVEDGDQLEPRGALACPNDNPPNLDISIEDHEEFWLGWDMDAAQASCDAEAASCTQAYIQVVSDNQEEFDDFHALCAMYCDMAPGCVPVPSQPVVDKSGVCTVTHHQKYVSQFTATCDVNVKRKCECYRPGEEKEEEDGKGSQSG